MAPSPVESDVAGDGGSGTLSVAGVDPERNFAGGETQVLGLSLELLAMGHRAELLCDPAGELWRRARAAGVVCHPLRIRNALDLRAALAMRRLLRNRGFDVVHFHTSRAHAMAPWVRGCARAAVVTRRMDYLPNRLFAPWLYGRAVSGVAAISTAVAEALERAGVEHERIAIIPSGVDCSFFHPPSGEERMKARAALGLREDDVAVGAVGALEPRKGHRHLLQAMALLEHRKRSGGDRTSALLVLAGDGMLRGELEAEAKRLAIDDRVRMLGRVENSRQALWAMDLFVMPSLQEGLGVALLEATACGLPAVASRTGGIVDVVEDGRTGVIVAPGDDGALAAAIAALLDDRRRCAAMGAAARARTMEHFSMRAMALQTVELYRACLQTVASRRAQ